MESSPPVGLTSRTVPPPAPPPARRGALLAAAYAFTIFLSAFLLFQVQPLIGKFILPWFGGTPAVWTTCLLFFQIVLFAGYAYADVVSSRLAPRKQAVVHAMLLIAGCLMLPIVPNANWKPVGSEQPVMRIVLLLGATVGFPFFVLSSTGPLLQGWFSRTHAGRSPYRLYALSNAGSLLALVSYPFVFDLLFPTRIQAALWSAGFAAFALSCGLCALGLASHAVVGLGSPGTVDSEAEFESRPPVARQLLWFALAMVPSILLLATTNQVCLDVASVPFLWVLPLTLYLLSFILCFDGERWYSRRFMMPAAAVSLVAVLPVLDSGATVSLGLQVLAYFMALFLCAMVCHGELVRLKPHARHLTSFYLLISAGGAAGGIFVAVVSPLIFKNYFELHVGLAACAALALAALFVDPGSRFYGARPRGLCGVMVLAVGGFGGALAYNAADQSRGVVAAARNFYGVLRVRTWVPAGRESEGGENPPPQPGQELDNEPYRYLLNGRILHGIEFLDPALRRRPTTYYGTNSGVGRILLHGEQPRRVGLVGLGIGTLAAYARPGDVFRFYEINAEVPKIARNYFHFLGDCRGRTEIVPGDARLTLEREPPQNFDVFVIDAFSGDAIPMHLLTREAFVIYLRHLAPDGVIAVHVSNRHFALRPVVDAAAEESHLRAITIDDGTDHNGCEPSTWVLLSRNSKSMDVGGIMKSAKPADDARVLWTDDHASAFQVLRERKHLAAQWQRILEWWSGPQPHAGD